MFFFSFNTHKKFENKKEGGCNDRKQKTPLGMETAVDGDMKSLHEYQQDIEAGEYAEVTESQRSNRKPVADTCPSPSPYHLNPTQHHPNSTETLPNPHPAPAQPIQPYSTLSNTHPIPPNPYPTTLNPHPTPSNLTQPHPTLFNSIHSSPSSSPTPSSPHQSSHPQLSAESTRGGHCLGFVLCCGLLWSSPLQRHLYHGGKQSI